MSTVAVNPPKTPVTKGSNGIAAATLPNVCKMPGPPAPFVPTPLPNIGQSGKSPQGYSTTVKIEGQPVAIKGASFGSSGDIASKGTGGGIVSSNAEGPTKFLAPGSLDVKIQGKNVQYLGDQMLNNCGPSGNPANSATMGGVLQVPVVAFEGDLGELADECNRKTNQENDHCPGGPEGADCTSLGTAKHKCCENAIKEYNKKNEGSPYESEVPFDEAGNKLDAASDAAARSKAAEAYHAAKNAGLPTDGVYMNAYYANGGGCYMKADVLVKGADGEYEAAFDFKFNCKDNGTMSGEQRRKYMGTLGFKPEIIHKDGRNCP